MYIHIIYIIRIYNMYVCMYVYIYIYKNKLPSSNHKDYQLDL